MIDKKSLVTVGAILLLAAFAAACNPKPEPTETPAPIPSEETEACDPLPFQDAWAGSGHADAAAQAFTHWNSTSAYPSGISAACVKCHTRNGLMTFLNGFPEDVAAPGGVVACDTCHNDATARLTSATFPGTSDIRGISITGLGSDAGCILCHMGTESKITVEAATQGMPDDLVNPALSFINIHYFEAAAIQYGGDAQSGYQYEGRVYNMKFYHTPGWNRCIDCHDPHSLEIEIDSCKNCHENVASMDDLKKIRMESSVSDYNGNGNISEGIYLEIRGLEELTLKAIQAYAREVLHAPIAYSSNSEPFFYKDTNGNGSADEGEAIYDSWTPRLLRAAYNYQLAINDPGAYIHNGKYVIELLYDSIFDLNTKLATPVDLSNAQRDDTGHFAGGVMAFRAWDEAGLVPGSCSKCHTATGLPQFISNGGTLILDFQGNLQTPGIIANPASDGLTCFTCHDEAKFPNIYPVASVTFPSGKIVSYGGRDASGNWIMNNSNICLTCHQGSQSTASINRSLGSAGMDEIVASLAFRDIHYYAAGATLFGNEVQGMYQFSDQVYQDRNLHPLNGSFARCTNCHDKHTGKVITATCAACHMGGENPVSIRSPQDTNDWDGDGDISEPLNDEIQHLNARLFAAIQKYAQEKLGAAIIYSPVVSPHWFVDKNRNGIADADELNNGNIYPSWTPRLLIAAYNYHYLIMDPGAYAHNGRYVIQVLYDTLKSMSVDVSKMTRPK